MKKLVICNSCNKCKDTVCSHRKELHVTNMGCFTTCKGPKGFLNAHCVVPRKYTANMIKPGMRVQLKSLNTIKNKLSHTTDYHARRFNNVDLPFMSEMNRYCGAIVEVIKVYDNYFIAKEGQWAWTYSCIKHIIVDEN